MEVPANSNKPQRTLPPVSREFLLMAMAGMHQAGRLTPEDDRPGMPLQFPGLDTESNLPNPADRMAPEGKAYPPAKPPKFRSAG